MFNKQLSKIFVVMMLGVVFIVPNFANAADPGITLSFDVQPGVSPKILPLNGQLAVRLVVGIDLAKYGPYCNNTNAASFKWSVYQDIVNGTDIMVGSEKTVSFERTQSTVSKTINDTITITDNGQGRTGEYVYKLYAFIECPDGTNASQSSNVQVTAGSGNPIYTCIVPNGAGYTYACSPANTTNCSDVPNCGNTCTQVRVSLCGDAAPRPTSGSSGGTTSTGTPGQTQNYSFGIENPLKGGATDFAGLVKILAQWIFNLAIPIAVAMIVYAGILFLTSQGEPGKITKAKETLTYAVIGLAIILIGSGFVTLIKSILELGGSSSNSGQQQTLPTTGGTTGGTTTLGVIGNMCSRDRDCISTLRCQDSICKRPTGNWATEPCNSARNCDVGLMCDKSDSGLQPVDGQNLGTCSQDASISGGQIGDVCQTDSNCINGLKCNKICQRKDGNLIGEPCAKTAPGGNCNSQACSTLGSNVVGTCVAKP